MTPCLFVSDVHGRRDRIEKLLQALAEQRPRALFLGGDLMPSALHSSGGKTPVYTDFITAYLAERLARLRASMKHWYPRIFLIMGNDDGRVAEPAVRDLESNGLWEYVHGRKAELNGFSVYGYSCVPPTPFLLKDWERYDVSRYVDPGCIAPEDGKFTVTVDGEDLKYCTIKEDLDLLAGEDDLTEAVFLFHSPPYQTKVDRAALDGRAIDSVPLDLHVGSIAIRRFIEARQPLLTLHGHVHESAGITQAWRDRIGRTHIFSAAHDGPELALVRFDLEKLDSAKRILM